MGQNLQYSINRFNFKCNAPIQHSHKGIGLEWKIRYFIENNLDHCAGQNQDYQSIQA